MKVRKFYLVNKRGKRYELLTRRQFLHSPGGLGYQESTIYQRLGEQFSVVDEGLEQGEITGSVFFPNPNAYDKYFEFVQFCRDTPIYLTYVPVKQEYMRQVRLDTIGKTEIEGTGLNCSVTFKALTLWYKRVKSINDSGDSSSGKEYEYTYDYRYSTNATNTVSFDSDSYNDSPIRLTIFGECTNPRWQHYVDNVLVATGAVEGTVQNGMKLVIDTTVVPYSIKQLNMLDEEVLNMYPLSDFSTDRFLLAKKGKNRISVSHSSADALSVMVEANISYASV